MSVSADAFWTFLLEQAPHYDQAILRDMRPTDGWLSRPKPCLDHLIEDARFLPKRLVSAYVMETEHPRMQIGRIAKRLNLKKETVVRRLELAWDIVDDELKAWLKTLPLLERRRERYKRLKTWRKSRPMVPKGDFGRFTSVFSDLKSEWPPESKLNCAQEPCDPRAPMRHWDD